MGQGSAFNQPPISVLDHFQPFALFLSALIWYMGHGQKNTGNWCFKDGEITLDEIYQAIHDIFFRQAAVPA